MTTLRERALEEHAERLAAAKTRQEREAAEHRALSAEHLRELLKAKLGIEATPTENEWIEDGICFHAGYAGYDYRWYLYIAQPCETCDSNRISGAITTLADIGAALNGSWMPHEHWWEDGSAKAPPPVATAVAPPTAEERLLDALRAFVAEAVQG